MYMIYSYYSYIMLYHISMFFMYLYVVYTADKCPLLPWQLQQLPRWPGSRRCGKPRVSRANHGKTMGKPQENDGFMGFYGFL